MPRIDNPVRYDAFFNAAVEIFRRMDLAAYRIVREPGSSLYRYVGYRDNMPQAENAGRTVWVPPDRDLSNRWTGWGRDQADSAQGLYTSDEFLSAGRPFPELEHYLDKEANPDALIAYYEYRDGFAPELKVAKAAELRSMFLFTQNRPLSGLQLRLHMADKTVNPLVKAIHDHAKQNNPQLIDAGETVESAYTSDHADFCRAVGNACLKVTDNDFFATSSVRDLDSTNLILRADRGRAVATLTPQGRATFFVNQGKVSEGCYTIADMLYNAAFEDAGPATGLLPSKQEFSAKLRAIGDTVADRTVAQYRDLIRLSPPNRIMEDVGQKLMGVKMGTGAIEEAASAIATVQDTIRRIDVGIRGSLQANEQHALKMTESVMGTLSEIVKGIDIAEREIAGEGHVEPPEHGIRDPAPHDIDILPRPEL